MPCWSPRISVKSQPNRFDQISQRRSCHNTFEQFERRPRLPQPNQRGTEKGSMKFFDTVDWFNTSPKWVSYFDLLGFGHAVKNDDWANIVSRYSQALDEFTWLEGKTEGIGRAWFSDTFLFYASDNSFDSFRRIEQVSRFFIGGLIQKKIPVRGAISCDDFCFDKSKQIFVGKGLVEAYECGEKYNWLGFVLCPSAARRLPEIGLDLPRLNYRQWNAEFKIKGGFAKESVWAYRIGAEHPTNGQNAHIGYVRTMRDRANEEHKQKYQNTIDFLEHVGVSVIISPEY